VLKDVTTTLHSPLWNGACYITCSRPAQRKTREQGFGYSGAESSCGTPVYLILPRTCYTRRAM